MVERVVATAKAPEAKQTCSNSSKQKPDFYSSEPATDMILQLQRTAGNRAVQRLVKSGALQAKHRINPPVRSKTEEHTKTALSVAPNLRRTNTIPTKKELGNETSRTNPMADMNSEIVSEAETASENLPESRNKISSSDIPQASSYQKQTSLASLNKRKEIVAISEEITGEKAGKTAENLPVESEKSSIEGKDPGQILEQLKGVMPTKAIDAYNQAQEASTPALKEQRQQVAQLLPEIPTPTGLPAIKFPHKEKGKVAGTLEKVPSSFEGKKTGRQGKEYKSLVKEAPPSQLNLTILKVSASKESTGNDAELAQSAKKSLENIQLNSSQISTDAGKRPEVDVTGEADPSQVETFYSESNMRARMVKAKASEEIRQEFGENNIFPEHANETLRARKELSSPKITSVKGGNSLSIPSEAFNGFNQSLGPVLRERIGEQKERYDAGKSKFDSDSANARADANKQIAKLNKDTRQKQIEEQNRGKNEVAKSRVEWQAELDSVEQAYQEKAGRATEEQAGKIAQAKQKGEKEAAKHLDEAESKAEKEKLRAEKEANEKKKEANKESKGFWGWVKSAAIAFIENLKKAVNFIYDNLRKAVKLIFEAAKALAKAAIELARMAIVGLIKGYGIILKGLVSVVFAAFPNTARKINSKIDRAINVAVKAVNKAAEYLKKGVEAVFDFLANTLDKLLGFIQSVFNGVFSAIGMIIRDEFKELMERIGSLVKAAKEMPGHLEGEVWEQLIGVDISEPMLGEAGYVPAKGTPNESEKQTGIQGESGLTEEDIAVDPVTTEPLDPELIEDLNLREGEEKIIGERNGEAYSVAGVLADFQEAEAGIVPTTSLERTSTPEIGPASMPTMSRAERAAKLWDQIKTFMGKWLKENWGKLLLATIGALVGLIAATILTGGAILAALPIIMKVVAAVFIGVAIMKAMEYLKTYLSEGWEKRIVPAAKALAGAIAVGIVELAMALGFRVIGAGLKAAGKAVKAGVKLAVTGVKRAATATAATIKNLLKSGAKLVSKSGSAIIRGSKLIFKGLEKGFLKGVKNVKDLANRLFKKFRVRKLAIQIAGKWIELWAYINPKYLVARAATKLLKGVDKSSVSKIKREVATKKKFKYKLGAVMEKISTKATEAKDVVEKVASNLASKKPGFYGKPDNIITTARGLIKEVQEVKYYGRKLLEDLGSLAKKKPGVFVEKGLGEGKFIQISKHIETIENIAANPSLVQGTVVTGVSAEIKYVLILPKFIGEDLEVVKRAVADMKAAWKNVLGVNVTVRYGSHSPKEIQEIVKGIKVIE